MPDFNNMVKNIKTEGLGNVLENVMSNLSEDDKKDMGSMMNSLL
jgi:hypothetical protein